MTEKIGKILDILSEAAGNAACACRLRYESATAIAREQARANQAIQFRFFWHRRFCYLLYDAISATASLTGLVVPLFPDGLVVPHPERITEDGLFLMRFAGWSKPGHDEPVNQIRSQLNKELQRLCAIHGIPQVWVVKIWRYEDRRVCFALAFDANIRAIRATKAAQETRNDRITI